MNLEKRINQNIAKTCILTGFLTLFNTGCGDVDLTEINNLKDKTQVEETIKKKRETLEGYVLSDRHKDPEFETAFTIKTLEYVRDYYKKPELMKLTADIMNLEVKTIVPTMMFWNELFCNQPVWVLEAAKNMDKGPIGSIKAVVKMYSDKLKQEKEKNKQNHPESVSRKIAKEFLDIGLNAGYENLCLIKNQPIPDNITIEYASDPSVKNRARMLLDNLFLFSDCMNSGRYLLTQISEENYSAHNLEILGKIIRVDSRAHSISLVNESEEDKAQRIKSEAEDGLLGYNPYLLFKAEYAGRQALNQLRIKRLEEVAEKYLEEKNKKTLTSKIQPNIQPKDNLSINPDSKRTPEEHLIDLMLQGFRDNDKTLLMNISDEYLRNMYNEPRFIEIMRGFFSNAKCILHGKTKRENAFIFEYKTGSYRFSTPKGYETMSRVGCQITKNEPYKLITIEDITRNTIPKDAIIIKRYSN